MFSVVFEDFAMLEKLSMKVSSLLLKFDLKKMFLNGIKGLQQEVVSDMYQSPADALYEEKEGKRYIA